MLLVLHLPPWSLGVSHGLLVLPLLDHVTSSLSLHQISPPLSALYEFITSKAGSVAASCGGASVSISLGESGCSASASASESPLPVASSASSGALGSSSSLAGLVGLDELVERHALGVDVHLDKDFG